MRQGNAGLLRYIDDPDSNGRSSLHWAVRNGHVAIMNLLIQAGADPRKPDRGEGVPNLARSSCFSPSPSPCPIATPSPYPIALPLPDGWTCMHYACRYRRPDCVKILLASKHGSVLVSAKEALGSWPQIPPTKTFIFTCPT